MNKEKPPVLKKKKIAEVINKSDADNDEFWIPEDSFERVAQAQRDADAAYYEPIIQQARQETDAISYTQGVLDGEKKVAREIFKEIERTYPAITKVLNRLTPYRRISWDEFKSKYLEGK